jgi:eukaryotic-like serine/threonine-protein kinase
MSLEIGQKLGPYEIIEQAGAGGMGEVFKANDTRLDRTVAIKILPANIADNPEFKERFDREAKAISSLNHAHICTLYDKGQANGIDYLVMEFLEGETLSERLSRGPIPYDEMLQIAVQIASGLDSAHHQGLTHRDLKPGNVMLTSEGAKLLDFGLAKNQFDRGTQGSTEITKTTPLTGVNTILGTMQYMAPEQLEGKDADARSDIFAFGAVMYEMSTGKKAFEGSSSATLIAAIIERDPISISAIMPMTPPLFERLVKKCLSKDPRKRWQSASDLSDELRWISQAGSQVGLPAHLAARRKFRFDLARVVGAVAIFSTLILAYLLYIEKTRPVPEMPVARYMVNIKQELSNIFWPRISPDGKSVAFHADDSTGTNRIWVRPINSFEAYPLLNTEDANRFFWSHDGDELAFFVGNQLKRISISGGQAQLVCQGSNGSDGCWSTTDLIIFDGSINDTMKIVLAGGGLARPAALVDTAAGEFGYAWPWFLPDGKHFLFTAGIRQSADSTRPASKIKLGSVDSTSSITLIEFDYNIDRIEYTNEGYILFVAQQNLMGLPFNAERLEVTGEPKPIAMSIGPAENTFAFSVSDNGTLLYQTDNQSSLSELAWIDRAGNKLETVGRVGRYSDLDLSPDETKIAYSSSDDATTLNDIWIYDLKRNVPTRLTFDPGQDGAPLWSPDGEKVYFSSLRNGQFFSIYCKDANGLGDVEPVYATGSSHSGPSDFAPDGNKLLIHAVSNGWDIGILSLSDSNRVDMLVNSSFFEAMARVSPNGQYVAYVSSESGNREIYVKKLDGTGGKWQISNEFADNPRWNGDGTELYYLTRDDRIMAVNVNTSESFEVGNPVELFQHRMQYTSTVSRVYDVSTDGQKFLVNSRLSDADPGEIVVVQNWAEEFRER